GHDRAAPGDARPARHGGSDRLVEGEYRQHARPCGQRGTLTGPSPVDPGKPHGDKDYDYAECRDLLRSRNIPTRIARKGIESSTRLGRYRYVIERCLEWTTRFRRLVRRYEREASHFFG